MNLFGFMTYSSCLQGHQHKHSLVTICAGNMHKGDSDCAVMPRVVRKLLKQWLWASAGSATGHT